MKTIKVFLASSEELEEDRKYIEIQIGRFNKEMVKKEMYIELIIWEDFFDCMSKTRLQDEYNNAIKGCDVFFLLAHNKVGKFTEEEFEVAFGHFKENATPLIFTLFKKPHTSQVREELQSLWSFEEKLNELGHYATKYENHHELIYKIILRLQKFENERPGHYLDITRAVQISTKNNHEVKLDISVRNNTKCPIDLTYARLIFTNEDLQMNPLRPMAYEKVSATYDIIQYPNESTLSVNKDTEMIYPSAGYEGKMNFDLFQKIDPADSDRFIINIRSSSDEDLVFPHLDELLMTINYKLSGNDEHVTRSIPISWQSKNKVQQKAGENASRFTP